MDERIHQMLEIWNLTARKPTPEELCIDCPELLTELKDAMAALSAADGFLGDPEMTQVSDAAAGVLFGARIPGYKILSRVGQGGQAVVYAAIKENTGRKVAVKVLLHGALISPQTRARFDREVAILAKLNHPNIVTVIDRGAAPDGSPYVVMDFVEGMPLDKYIAAPMSPASDSTVDARLIPDRGEMLVLFSKICDAVQVAHEQGVIHRDLKPNNILIDARNEPHILDFGVARSNFNDPNQRHVSITDQFLGTLAWSSPEQADARELDQRTDVYSLGLILYYMLTGGKFPYNVLGPMAKVLNNILQAQPIPPSEVLAINPARRGHEGQRNYLPPEPPLNPIIESIVLKALSKKPEDRFSTAGEMAAAIRNYLSGLEVGSRTAAVRSGGVKWLPFGITALIAVIIGVAVHERPRPASVPITVYSFPPAAVVGDPKKSPVPSVGIVAPTTSITADPEMPNEMGVLRRLDSGNKGRNEFQFLPDSRRLLTMQPNMTRIWDLETGEFRSFQDCMGISVDGRWLYIANQRSIIDKLVNIETGLHISAAELSHSQPRFILFNRSQHLVFRLNLDEGLEQTRFDSWPEYSADGRYRVSTAQNLQQVLISDAATIATLTTFDHRTEWANAAHFSPNGNLILVPIRDEKRNSLWVWDWKQGKSSILGEPIQVGPHGCFSPDSRRLFVGTDGSSLPTLTMWEVSDAAAPKRVWEQHPFESLGAFSFSPDGRRLLLANHNDSRDLSMTDSETGNEIYGLHDDRIQDNHGIYGLTISPNGHLAASTGIGGVVTIWRLRDPTPPLATQMSK